MGASGIVHERARALNDPNNASRPARVQDWLITASATASFVIYLAVSHGIRNFVAEAADLLGRLLEHLG